MRYTINNYRSRKVGNKYFVTTDHGSYCLLDKKEHDDLDNKQIDEELAEKLWKSEVILDEDNFDEAVRLTKNRYDFLCHGTSLHIIVLTLRCNMNCIYCHASSVPDKADSSYDMDKETAKKTVDFIFQSPNNVIKIEFQGGEPTLNWDIVEFIVEYAYEKNKIAKKNLMLSLVTNFTNMTDERLDYLIDNRVGVCSSLDGPKELHDYNRIYTGGSNYDQVVGWMKKLNDKYNERGWFRRRPHALVTLTRKSLDYPREIIDEYVKLGMNDVHLRFLNNLGIASKAWPKISYTVDEYLKFWKEAVEYLYELKAKGVHVKERMVNYMERKIKEEYDPNYLDLRSPCGAAIGQLAYNHNGDIYTCDEGRMTDEDIFKIGDVKTDQYKDVVTCDKACAITNASINDQYMCNECAYKPYCGICPVINFAEQGNIIGKIPQTDTCKKFMSQFDWVVENIIIDK